MLYEAYHRIVAVTPRPGAEQASEVVGPLCETSDTLGHDRRAWAGRGRRPPRGARRRRVRIRDGVELQPAAVAGGGAGRRRRVARDPAAARPTTTCSRLKSRGLGRDSGFVGHRHDSGHGRMLICLRRPRSERQGNAGAAAAPVVRGARPRQVESLDFPTTTRRSGRRSGRACTASATTAPTRSSCCYIANRHEFKPRILEWLAAGRVVICDRYTASSVAYGEAQGLDAHWLASVQVYLPQPSADDPARHRARGGRGAQGEGPRQVRERPADARARPRELPAPGRRPAVARRRRGAPGRRSSPPTSLAPWRHDSGCGKRPHLGGSGREQHAGARVQRRARRAHVVHQHHDLPGQARGRGGFPVPARCRETDRPVPGTDSQAPRQRERAGHVRRAARRRAVRPAAAWAGAGGARPAPADRVPEPAARPG